MKKLYITPESSIVSLNVANTIMAPMLQASQDTAYDDPEGADQHESTITYGGNASDLEWGGHAKQHEAWDSWD